MINNQDLRKYFEMFLRWLWLILICAAVAGGVAYWASTRKVPIYRAAATMVVSPTTGGNMSEYTAVLLSQRLVQTYGAMMTARPVMQAVIDELGLPGSPQALASRVEVTLVPDTQLIRLSVVHTDPYLAAGIANAVADAFTAQNQTMQQQRYTESLANVQQQMDELALQMNQVQVTMDGLGTPQDAQAQTELARLESVLAAYRNTYATLVRSYETMRMEASQSGDNVFLFEPAVVPQYPIGSGRLRSTLLAALVGAVAAIGIGLLVEFLDDTIKTPDDVQEVLGLDTLGIIGQMRQMDKELIVPDMPRSPVTEAYRGLRTNIRFSSVDKPLHTLLVTSANASEGKSVTVANLAASIAEAELSVVAVDADLRRPRLHELFEMNRTGGLTQALLDGRLNGNVQPALYMGRLSVLPAGELPPNPAELLGSRRMRELLEQIKGRVDMVLIDSPPINPVTDAAVLAQAVDGVLLVVDAGQTRKGAARRAVDSMRQVGANVIGVVLNAVPVKRGGYYYYYYYHGEYGADGTRSSRRRERGRMDRLVRFFGGKKQQRLPKASPSSRPAATDGAARSESKSRTR